MTFSIICDSNNDNCDDTPKRKTSKRQEKYYRFKLKLPCNSILLKLYAAFNGFSNDDYDGFGF